MNREEGIDMRRKKEKWMKNDKGMGTVEIILIIVVIFTIYKGCK